MTGQNLDFSNKIKDLFSKRGSDNSPFVEKVILALQSKMRDYNSKNLDKQLALSQVKEVYKRGINDAIRLDKPIGLWAMARLNLFFRLAKGGQVPYSYEKADRDILDNGSFHIDDGTREDVTFSYEQIAESKFDLENFGLDFDEDYSFIDLEEYTEANFPKVIKEDKEDIPKYKEKVEEKEKKKAVKKINEDQKKKDKDSKKLKESDNEHY